MAMYPLFAVPASRTRAWSEDEEGTSISGLPWIPLAASPPPLSQRGRWRAVLYFFCFSSTFTFVSWPSFNSIFHNWLYSPVAKTLDPSLRSLFKSHGSNPGQDKILKI
jgi:hypothetical protein